MANLGSEVTVSTHQAYRGKIVNVRVDSVRLPTGAIATREIVEHGNSVCIVPLDEANNVLMVRQYRKPAEEVLLEVPAGGVEAEEVWEEAVLRELQEETGYTALKLNHLATFWTTPGFCTELMRAYLATELRAGDPRHRQDEDENVQLVKVPLDRVQNMIREGQIKDAKSIASLLMALSAYRRQDAA